MARKQRLVDQKINDEIVLRREPIIDIAISLTRSPSNPSTSANIDTLPNIKAVALPRLFESYPSSNKFSSRVKHITLQTYTSTDGSLLNR